MDRSTDTARTGSRSVRSRQSLLVALAFALLAGGALLLHAATVHAGGPGEGESLVQQGLKLTGGASEAEEGRFGSSAALSADGSTLLIGAPHDDGTRGSAWVFERNGNEWVHQGPKLGPGALPEAGAEGECTGGAAACPSGECAEEPSAAPEEEGECAFGASVAISANGNTAVVGDPTASSQAGAVWVFRREGSGEAATWTRTGALVGGNSLGEGRFGKSVAISADGSLVLVGAPSALGGRGAAWLFADEGGTWTRLEELTDVEQDPSAHFGRSVALSGDGATALVGGPGDAGVGAAWTFARNGLQWSQQAPKLIEAGASAGEHFGKSVALSSDGSTALIGAWDGEAGRGTASPFIATEGGFVAQGLKLVGPEGEVHFGASVALSGDGSIGLVGAPRAASNGGTVTELTRSAPALSDEAAWTAKPAWLSGTEAKGKGMMGAAVALSSDGKVAALGSPRDDRLLGAAWVFADALPPLPVIEGVSPGRGSAAGGTTVKIKGEFAGEASGVSFGGTPATSFTTRSTTEVEAVTPAHAPGRIDVTVTTPGGTSVPSAGDRFVFEGEAEDPPGDPAKGGEGSTSGNGGNTKTSTAAAGGVAGFTSAADAACRVSLRKARLAVTRYRTVALRLTRTGAGACRGKLALSYRVKAKGRRGYALQTVGTASFSIAAGTSKVVKVTLTKAGRKWFRSHHGKANASLAIARVVPAPMTARSASVRLSVKKTLQR
jgi:IPT/TIG domain/FG-GAP repeat